MNQTVKTVKTSLLRFKTCLSVSKVSQAKIHPSKVKLNLRKIV